jgi:hypothetical protein
MIFYGRSPMIATKLAALMGATILAASISISPLFLGAEAQIATIENGVGIVDQSNVKQTIEQVQNQEACTDIASPAIPGGSVLSGAQSNDCEVDQTQTANAVSSHETTKNIIRNLPG